MTELFDNVRVAMAGLFGRYHRLELVPTRDLAVEAGVCRVTGPAPEFSVVDPAGPFQRSFLLLRLGDMTPATGPVTVTFAAAEAGSVSRQSLRLTAAAAAEGVVTNLPRCLRLAVIRPPTDAPPFLLSGASAVELGDMAALFWMGLRQARARACGFGVALGGGRGLVRLLRMGARAFRFRLAELEYREGRFAVAPWAWYALYAGDRERPRGGTPADTLPHEFKCSVLVTLGSAGSAAMVETVRSALAQNPRPAKVMCLASQDADTPTLAAVADLERIEPRLGHVVAPGPGSGDGALPAALASCMGDWVCLLDPGDVLEPHTFRCVASAAAAAKPDLIYGDRVTTDDDGRTVRAIDARPAFSWDHYASVPFLGRPLFVRRRFLMDALAGGLAPDDDLVLRLLEFSPTVTHVADILSKRRDTVSVNPVPGAWPEAVRRHLRRLGVQATVTSGALSEGVRVRFGPRARTRVAVIIPTRDRADLLARCVTSLERTIVEPEVSLVIVDHDSTDPAARALLETLSLRHRVVPWRGPFLYSRMMNRAATDQAPDADTYLFLNNDVEALASGWLASLLGLVARPDVAVAGPALIYPNGDVQHAGVVVVRGVGPIHAFCGLPLTEGGRRRPGPAGALVATREVSAVTAACMLVRADAFHAVGGFDESFAVGFGDTDLCLRLRRAGWRVLYDGSVTLVHHESATRGRSIRDPHPTDTARFQRRWREVIDEGDPFGSPLVTWSADPEVLCPTALTWQAPTLRTVRVTPPAGVTSLAPDLSSCQTP